MFRSFKYLVILILAIVNFADLQLYPGPGYITTTLPFCYSANDPHMKSFDGLYYEFQHSGYYVMYHDFKNITVFAGYEPCNAGSYATCNCAIQIKYKNSLFYWDTCGIWSGGVNKRFFYKEGSGSVQHIQCNSKKVAPLNEIKTSWWSTAGNAQAAGSNFLCAESLRIPNAFFIRTNDPDTSVNVAIRVDLHARGITYISILPGAGQLGNTAGLCGLWDGLTNNDFAAINILPVTKPSSRRRRSTPLDQLSVLDPNDSTDQAEFADSWLIKYFSSATDDFRNTDYTLQCPCDTTPDTCTSLLSACSYEQLLTVGETILLTDVTRTLSANTLSEADAIEACNELLDDSLNELKDEGYMTVLEETIIRNNCKLDMMATDDSYWTLQHTQLLRVELIRRIDQIIDENPANATLITNLTNLQTDLALTLEERLGPVAYKQLLDNGDPGAAPVGCRVV